MEVEVQEHMTPVAGFKSLWDATPDADSFQGRLGFGVFTCTELILKGSGS